MRCWLPPGSTRSSDYTPSSTPCYIPLGALLRPEIDEPLIELLAAAETRHGADAAVKTLRHMRVRVREVPAWEAQWGGPRAELQSQLATLLEIGPQPFDAARAAAAAPIAKRTVVEVRRAYQLSGCTC